MPNTTAWGPPQLQDSCPVRLGLGNPGPTRMLTRMSHDGKSHSSHKQSLTRRGLVTAGSLEQSWPWYQCLGFKQGGLGKEDRRIKKWNITYWDDVWPVAGPSNIRYKTIIKGLDTAVLVLLTWKCSNLSHPLCQSILHQAIFYHHPYSNTALLVMHIE